MSNTMQPASQITKEEKVAAINMTKEQYIAYQEEMERIEMTIAKGEETEATYDRMNKIDAFIKVAPWMFHPDHGVIPVQY